MGDTVAVVGQVARDLVLVVPEVPDAGGSVPVRERREMLGGKGANIAVASAQLGMSVSLLGVVGDDDVADDVLRQARADGIDTTPVVRRTGTRTALLVDVVDGNGTPRYLEDVPEGVLLTAEDIRHGLAKVTAAASVVIQLQQPAPAALAAARAAREAGRRTVLDGVPEDRRDDLLALADVLRADRKEGELLTGESLADNDTALRAGRELLRHGPSLVALATGEGNVFVWPGGHVAFPLGDAKVVDTTGGGDALVATLTWALARGVEPAEAGRLAVAASGATVSRPGGRPDLDPDRTFATS